MLFMIAGYLKPDAEEQLINFRTEFNEHFAQAPLVAAGVLRGEDGKRRGYLGFVEADGIDGARRFVHESPYFQEGFYDHVEIFEYDVEVGAIGA